MEVIRVLLVDDQSLFVKSLEIVLQTLAKDLAVVGVFYNGREVVEYLEDHEADIVLMDIRMPEMDGVQAVKLIHQRDPSVKIVMLTTFDDDQYIKDALENGAAGYVLKNIEPAELISYIRAVVNRSIVVSDQVLSRILSIGERKATRRDPAWVSEASLSQREAEVAQFLVNGYTNSEIAEKLFIAEQTVRNHISAIYGKTGIHSRGELIKIIRDNEGPLSH
jgi:DNA-binding NarL/FixJ family response regulator